MVQEGGGPDDALGRRGRRRRARSAEEQGLRGRLRVHGQLWEEQALQAAWAHWGVTGPWAGAGAGAVWGGQQ